MQLGIPVYAGVDLLDVAGPYEMFKWVAPEKGLEAILLSEDGGPVISGNGVRFEAHSSFAATPTLNVLWVPGGAPDASQNMMLQPESSYFSYLKKIAAKAKWVCSVCEGALLLAAAGLLDGHKATTHWAFVNCLKQFQGIDVDSTHQRFVVSGNRLTGGGISSGLDEALKLITLLFDETTAIDVQQITQYFPQPPVSGTIPQTPECLIHWQAKKQDFAKAPSTSARK
jgi:transcriptional regulator GlxA family with amidase domain